MRNLQDIFKTSKRSFISASSICMTVRLIYLCRKIRIRKPAITEDKQCKQMERLYARNGKRKQLFFVVR